MKILAIAAVSALVATQAYAGTYETRCETTKVPYQATVKSGEPEKVIGGAIVGGVIGNQFGSGSGKTAATVAGAAAGAAVGANATN